MAYTEDLTHLYPERLVNAQIQPQQNTITQYQKSNYYPQSYPQPIYVIREEDKDDEPSDFQVGAFLFALMVATIGLAVAIL